MEDTPTPNMAFFLARPAMTEVAQDHTTHTSGILGEIRYQAVFPDILTKLSKWLDPAHVTPTVELCVHIASFRSVILRVCFAKSQFFLPFFFAPT